MIYIENSLEKYVSLVLFSSFSFKGVHFVDDTVDLDNLYAERRDSDGFIKEHSSSEVTNYYENNNVSKFCDAIRIEVSGEVVANVGFCFSSRYDKNTQGKCFISIFNMYFNKEFKDALSSSDSVIDIADIIKRSLVKFIELVDASLSNVFFVDDLFTYVNKHLD